MKTNNKINASIFRRSAAALFFAWAIIALCSAINLTAKSPKVPTSQDNAAFGESRRHSRTLSFADRVAYQRAIEKVFWRHRIWPETSRGTKPLLDAVMSQAELEKKVTNYLRNSQALQDDWQKPITAEQLQGEMERMASHTKQPKVLREIFRALGNDPFVIAECLARPVLAEHLISELNAEDEKPATIAWKKPLQLWLARSDTQVPVTMTAVSSANYTLPVIATLSSGCTDDTWPQTTTLTNAPSGRYLFTAVWTGSEMIVWGGETGPGTFFNTGGRYDPSTDSWTPTSTAHAPTGRRRPSAVWTGSEMIVWGGYGDCRGDGFCNTGGRYNPSTDSWTATSTTNAPSARSRHGAIWSGSEMIVWGGRDLDTFGFDTGGRYDPSTDSWTPTSLFNVPPGRQFPTAIWTGSEMIVWFGCVDELCNQGVSSGGIYNPNTDSWSTPGYTNVPSARTNNSAVLTDSEMIVWGGYNNGSYLDTGGIYDLSTGSWTATSTINAPSGRSEHTAVWTGSEMIVWGGNNGSPLNTGGRYTPETDSWVATSTTNAPSSRYEHIAVWTDSETEMIVWGGREVSFAGLNTGGRYCAQSGPPITLDARVRRQGGNRVVALTWSPADGGSVDILRDGVVINTTDDDGSAKDKLGTQTGTFTYQVCETDSGDCSNEVRVRVRTTDE